MVLSTSTVITIATILLLVCIFGITSKALSTAMTVLGICVLVVIIIQATSDVVLIDFGNLLDVIIGWALKLFQWAQDTFWPTLTDVARDIEKTM